MKLTKVLFTFGLLMSMQSAFAHALWFKTDSKGAKGTQHDIQVYFAEPGEKWESLDGDEWKMVKGFELWVVSPKGEKTLLTCTPDKDHYKANFTPNEDGRYVVVLKHEKIGVLSFGKGDPFVPFFYATATVDVGATADKNIALSSADFLPMSIISALTVNSQKVGLQITAPNGLAYKVSVITPAGKKNDLPNGTVEFDAIEAGLYQIEVSAMDSKAGEFGGKQYKKAYHIATTTFQK